MTQVYEQLGALIRELEQAGWVKVNGNTWEHTNRQCMMTTAYTWGEASVQFVRRSWVANYRGAELEAWFATSDDKLVKYIRTSLPSRLTT